MQSTMQGTNQVQSQLANGNLFLCYEAQGPQCQTEITTIGVNYGGSNVEKVYTTDPGSKAPVNYLNVHTIQGKPEFRNVSREMMRVIDLLAVKNQKNMPNYESIC